MAHTFKKSLLNDVTYQDVDFARLLKGTFGTTGVFDYLINGLVLTVGNGTILANGFFHEMSGTQVINAMPKNAVRFVNAGVNKSNNTPFVAVALSSTVYSDSESNYLASIFRVTSDDTKITKVENVGGNISSVFRAVLETIDTTQKRKITNDSGGQLLNWKSETDLENDWKEIETGLYTGYAGNNKVGMPDIRSGRLLVNKQQLDGIYGHGFIININYANDFFYKSFSSNNSHDWRKMNTSTTYTGTTPIPPQSVINLMKKGDVYYYIAPTTISAPVHVPTTLDMTQEDYEDMFLDEIPREEPKEEVEDFEDFVDMEEIEEPAIDIDNEDYHVKASEIDFITNLPVERDKNGKVIKRDENGNIIPNKENGKAVE